MNQAFEKHVLQHKNKGAKDTEAKRIEDKLISQLFNIADESKI
jgi:hypothetical protein